LALAYGGRADAARLLLESRAEADARSVAGLTPFHELAARAAVCRRHLQNNWIFHTGLVRGFVQALLASDADPSASFTHEIAVGHEVFAAGTTLHALACHFGENG
jgi:hypothetical protein